MKILSDFDMFINPCGDVGKIKFYYDYISFDCLKICSYVRYLVFDDKRHYLLDLVDLYDFPILEHYNIFAINYLDNLCLPVLLH